MSLVYKVKSLENGVRLATIKNPGLNSVVVHVGVRVGSRYEGPGTCGATHFLEHMLFQGTKRYSTSKALSQVIDAHGGEHNAETDKDRTSFFVQIASPFANVAVDLVHDMLANSLFRTKDINKERSVIQEEISGYENDPDQVLMMMSDFNFYTDGGMAHPITGQVADVEFGPSVIRGFFNDFYVPSRISVALAGNFDNKVVDLASRKFGSLQGNFTGWECARTGFRVKNNFQVGNTDKIHMSFRLPTCPSYTRDSKRVYFLSMILGGSVSSRLFQSLRDDKGLCYGVSSMPHEYLDIGSLLINTTVDVDKFQQTVDVILKELTKLSKKGITKDEFARARTNVQGFFATVMDRPMALADSATYQLNERHEIEPIESRLKQYMSIKQTEVDEIASRFLDLSQLSLSIVGPKSSQGKVQKIFDKLSP